jgi:hypothetical protein
MRSSQYLHRDKGELLFYKPSVSPGVCTALLKKINITNYGLIFGFVSELDKSIPVSVLSMCCIHVFVDRLLNMKSVLQAEN